MSADDFRREVVEHGGDAYRLLLRHAAPFHGFIAQLAACNASHNLEQRFARSTLLAHDRVARETFPLTHEFLAMMLGVRRADLSRAAAALRLAGAIEYLRRIVTILDRERPMEATCGCYLVIRDLMEAEFTA